MLNIDALRLTQNEALAALVAGKSGDSQQTPADIAQSTLCVADAQHAKVLEGIVAWLEYREPGVETAYILRTLLKEPNKVR